MSGPDYLDYKSQGRAYALAFSSSSSLGNSSPSIPKSSRSSFSSVSSPLPPFPTDLKLAIGSYSDNAGSNDITVVGLNPALLQDFDKYAYTNWSSENDNGSAGSSSDFVPLAKHATPYPVTKVGFSPSSLASRLQQSTTTSDGREMVASTSDCLRLFDFTSTRSGSEAGQGSSGFVGRKASRASYSLTERSLLSSAKSDVTAPLTSFDWSCIDPATIVTSSIDTTCTVWDISTGQAVTQLISHDREVFDVAWSPTSKDIFASVGADGSVRSFDLRQLDHSTILYESSAAGPGGSSSSKQSRGTPLLRLAFNPSDANSVAVIHANSPVITLLDVRSPGLAVDELRGHGAAVNGIAWQGSGGNSSSPATTDASNENVNGYQEYPEATLASVSDDGCVYMWDIRCKQLEKRNKSQATLPRIHSMPDATYSIPLVIDSIAWGGGREYLAICMGDTVRCLKV